MPSPQIMHSSNITTRTLIFLGPNKLLLSQAMSSILKTARVKLPSYPTTLIDDKDWTLLHNLSQILYESSSLDNSPANSRNQVSLYSCSIFTLSGLPVSKELVYQPSRIRAWDHHLPSHSVHSQGKMGSQPGYQGSLVSAQNLYLPSPFSNTLDYLLSHHLINISVWQIIKTFPPDPSETPKT